MLLERLREAMRAGADGLLDFGGNAELVAREIPGEAEAALVGGGVEGVGEVLEEFDELVV